MDLRKISQRFKVKANVSNLARIHAVFRDESASKSGGEEATDIVRPSEGPFAFFGRLPARERKTLSSTKSRPGRKAKTEGEKRVPAAILGQ